MFSCDEHFYKKYEDQSVMFDDEFYKSVKLNDNHYHTSW